MITSVAHIEVRYAETDMMGIAHHASYLPWLEIARGNLLKERGISYAKLEESGILLPVVEIKMNYHRPATYDDVVTIHSSIVERPFAKIRVDYELLKSDQPIASGYSIHAFMNRSGQPIKAPKFILEMLSSEFD